MQIYFNLRKAFVTHKVLPDLEKVIKTLKKKESINNYNNQYNILKWRAERVRNNIMTGVEVDKRDYMDIMRDFKRLGL